MKCKTAAFAAIVLAALLSSPASADGSATYAISVDGFVPVICRVDASAQVVTATGNAVDLGQFSEFCNDGHGYELWVDTAGADGSESIRVDDTVVPLSTTGSTLIATSDFAGSRTRHLTLDTGDGAAPPSISVRIVPL